MVFIIQAFELEALKPENPTSCFSYFNERFPPYRKFVREITKSKKLIHFSAILLLNCNGTDKPVSNASTGLREKSAVLSAFEHETRRAPILPSRDTVFPRILGILTYVIASCNMAR